MLPAYISFSVSTWAPDCEVLEGTRSFGVLENWKHNYEGTKNYDYFNYERRKTKMNTSPKHAGLLRKIEL